MTEAAPPSITIEAFAAVQAAEQDDIALEEALVQQEIDGETWSRERGALLEQITADASSFKSYQAALEQAQDDLFRPIDPLFEDVSVWVAYAGTAEAGDMSAFLKKHGLTLGDFARLERHWRKRFEGDRSLAKRAKEARSASVPEPLPPITIGERANSRSAGSQEAAVAAEPKRQSSVASEDLLARIDRVAALAAFVSTGEQAADRTEAGDEVKSLKQDLEGDTALQNLFRQRMEHHRRIALNRANAPSRAVVGREVSVSPMMSPAARLGTTPARAAVDATGLVDAQLLAAEALPFDNSRLAQAPKPVVPDLDPLAESTDETGELNISHLTGLATPFEKARVPTINVAAPVQGAPSVDATAPIEVIQVDIPDLPFAPDPTRSPPPLATPDLDPLAESVDGTAEVNLQHLAKLALPFPVAENASTPEAEPPAHGTDVLPAHEFAWEQSVDETAALDLSILDLSATPFGDNATDSAPPSVVPKLETDVKTYASYRVDLDLDPAGPDGVRNRYQVADLAAHERLQQRWQAKVAASPALREELGQAMRTYREWLEANEGRRM